MRLLKEEGTQLRPADDDKYFPHDLMARIAKAVLFTNCSDDSTVRDEFIQKYLDEYHDVRYSFLFVTMCVCTFRFKLACSSFV